MLAAAATQMCNKTLDVNVMLLGNATVSWYAEPSDALVYESISY